MRNEISNDSRPLAVVTGASSGIGRELAKVFAEEDYDLLIVAEDEGILGAADECRGLGAQVHSVQFDLATQEGTENFYKKIQELGRPVECLALNAGVGSGGEFIKTDLEKELNLIRLNIMSAVILTKKVLPEMVTRGAGKILFTSSIAAESPGPYEAVYAASKAFIQSFALGIRQEVEEKGITVTALQPGATDTNFFARADMLETPVGEAEKDDPAKVARQGYDALMAGKEHVVAGSMMNKVNVAGTKLMSEKQGAKMQAKQTKPKSLH